MRQKKTNRKKAVILTGLAVVLAALVIIFFMGTERENVGREVLSALSKSHPEESKSKATRDVTLFFLSEDDEWLHPEKREIAAGASQAEAAEIAVNELIKGSADDLLSPLPPETKVRQVFIAKDGTAFVDFTKDISENFNYGAASEMSAIYAVVNTLTFNFDFIKKVSLLIEGGEKETLGGHIDLSKPFLPQNSLVAR